MGRLRFSFGVLALSACVVGSPAAAFAETTDRDRAAARAAADAGADAFDQQRYADAVELFGRAEKLVHATPHLLFIARSLVKLGRLVEAHETYLKITREKLAPSAPNAFKRAQGEAEKEVAEVAPRLAYTTLRVDGAASDAVQVLMDDAELPAAVIGIEFPVDPGTHVFRAKAGADRGDPVTVRFEEGSHHGVALKIVLTKQPVADANDSLKRSESNEGAHTNGGAVSNSSAERPTGLLIAGSIMSGLGAVAGGVSIYFAASSSSHRGRGDDIQASCDPGCSEDQKNYVYAQDDLADADRKRAIYTAIPAGALLAAGVALIVVYATSGPHAAAESAKATPNTMLVGGTNWLGVSTRF